MRINNRRQLPKDILVVGCHRSGTSFLGDIITSAGRFWQLYEPFKKYPGLAGIEHYYPYARPTGGTCYTRIVDDFFRRQYQFKANSLKGPLHRAVKRWVGGRHTIQANVYRYGLHLFFPLLVKDPLASFLAAYVARQDYAKIIVSIRHPCGFVASCKALRWDFDLDNFLDQPDLIADELNHLKEQMLDARDTTERLSLCWIAVYSTLRKWAEREPEKWLVVKHEDVCAIPREVFSHIGEFGGFEISSKKMDKLVKRVRPDMLDNWRERLSQRDAEIIWSLCESTACEFYEGL